MGDCAFAELDEPFIPEGNPESLPEGGGPILPAFQRVGYITFESLDGQCYWYNDAPTGSDVLDQMSAYYDYLGSDWQAGRVLAVIAVCIAWLVFMYSISFCCSSQVRAVRYFIGFVLSILLTIFQGMTFFVFGTKFCDENGCRFSRSAGFSIGAMVSYFIAGIFFFLTSDYPGAEALSRVTNTNEGADEEAPASKENNSDGDEEVEAKGVDEENNEEQPPSEGPKEETPAEETPADDVEKEVEAKGEVPTEETPADDGEKEVEAKGVDEENKAEQPPNEGPTEETPAEKTPADDGEKEIEVQQTPEEAEKTGIENAQDDEKAGIAD